MNISKKDRAILQGLARRVADIAGLPIQPGATLEEHVNEYYEEIYFIISGTATAIVNGEKHKVRDGDAIHLPKNTRHGMVNDSEDMTTYLIFGAGKKHPDEFI